jgi:hypothetical protein
MANEPGLFYQSEEKRFRFLFQILFHSPIASNGE